MADIIDAFVVSLGIDSRDYKKEIKDFREDQKRLRAENAAYSREQQDNTKRQVEGIRSLRNETVGFLLVLGGANSIKGFAANILTGDAATGRFAANIGVATERLGVWEEAVKRAGGTAQEGRAALGVMSQAFQSLQLTGTTGQDAAFQGLGVTARDLKNPETALLKISEAASRMPRAEFTTRARALGLTDADITVLAKGRVELERYLEYLRRLGVANEDNAKAAIDFDNAMSDIEQTLKAKARPAIDGVANILSTFASNQNAVNGAVSVGIGLLGAAAIVAGIAYAPFFALATVIGVLAANWTKVKEIGSWIGEHGLGTFQQGKEVNHGTMPSQIWKDIQENGLGHLQTTDGSKPDLLGSAAQAVASIGSSLSNSAQRGPVHVGAVSNQVLSNGAGGTDPEIYRALAARYGPQVARGITAGIKAEGGSLGMAANGAFGIGQWRGPRLKALMRRYGANPSKADQIAFLMSELEGGDHGGPGVLASRDADSALSNYIGGYNWGFMRPGEHGRVGDMQRGMAALHGRAARGAASGGGGNQSTSIGQIVIYSAATDAEGIAHDMRGALAKRGLVVQANTGLQP